MEFLGKLHPLILHLPIGLLIAAFALEWLNWRKTDLKLSPATNYLLGAGAITAILAALFGYFLSLNGGYEAGLINVHKWTGIGVALLSTLFYYFRKRNLDKRKLLRWGWAANLLLLAVAGHYGGSLTHGQGYLMESAPAFVQNIFGKKQQKNLNDMPLDSALVFADIIQPIMERKCWSCHSSGKAKGGLNLESLKGWKRGGRNGELVVAGNPDQSLLLNRVYLPLSEKEHMPPQGKPQLLPSEVALLEWWISQEADFENPVAAHQLTPKVSQILNAEFGVRDIYASLDVKPLSPKKIQELQDQGIKIYPLSLESPLLEVSFTGDTIITDEQLSLLKKARKQIVRLDLSRSGIQDDQLKFVNQLPNLIHLFLQNTDISDEGLSQLKDLQILQYLNLYNTSVSDNGLAVIDNLKNLKDLYLWQTNASKEQVLALQKRRPGVNIDFGAILPDSIQQTTVTEPVEEDTGD